MSDPLFGQVSGALGRAGWSALRMAYKARGRLAGRAWSKPADAELYTALHSEPRHASLLSEADAPETRFFAALKPGARVLEIGSRRIVAPLDRGRLPPGSSYVGFDIMEGPNVDVVGDAHDLAAHFEPGSFDAVLSYAVFEHIAMPWKVALELNRVLKPGGLVYIASHHAYPTHELPWDFWRYGHDAFSTAFGAAQGFRRLDRSLRWSARVVRRRQLRAAEPGLRHYLYADIFAEKIADTDPARIAWDLDYREALPPGHFYPKGTYQLADEAAAYGADCERHRARVARAPDAWARLRARLAPRGQALLVCGEGGSRPFGALPGGWRAEVLRLSGPEDAARLDALPRERYDLVVAAEALGRLAHPWVSAPALAASLKVGGHLFVHERATPAFEAGRPDFWSFTSESLPIVFHPVTGLRHLEGAFVDPWIVVPDELTGLPGWGVEHALAYRWAYGAFVKERSGDAMPGRWPLR